MRIGLAYNLRPPEHASHESAALGDCEPGAGGLALPLDDRHEEFDSPETIDALARALASLGHEVECLGDGEPLVRRLLEPPRPELVWNIAEGTGGGRGREARVPALLEMLNIPYTGSDPLTLAAALDKDCAKRLITSHNLVTPAWVLFSGQWEVTRHELARLRFPVFVKPAFEGSSKGILTTSVIDDLDQLEHVLGQLAHVYRQPVLVEEFIDGDELTVGLIGNAPPEVLGVMRMLPRHADGTPFVYGLEMKRDWQNRVSYECPAELSPRDTAAVRAAALGAWHALGCRDVARIDFRLRDGVPYFLEANPLPGMSPVSGDLVILARALGIEHAALVGRVLDAALDRLKLAHQSPAPVAV